MAYGVTQVPDPQPPPMTERRQTVKTKTLGRMSEAHDADFREKLELQQLNRKQYHEQQQSDEEAEKRREAILQKVGGRRHLHYSVIDDAEIIQVSVINSEDGTLVRKYPPDEVVDFIRQVKQKRSGRHSLDITI